MSRGRSKKADGLRELRVFDILTFVESGQRGLGVMNALQSSRDNYLSNTFLDEILVCSGILY